MYEREILELFKVMIVNDSARGKPSALASIGVVTDFVPTRAQKTFLEDYFKPLDVRTLFTREERDNADTFDLITKQLLHYFEVYGPGSPGMFNLEVTTGTIITANFVRGVDANELGDMVRALLYRNAPVDDAVTIRDIIKHYGVDYDVNKIANNELRVALFNPKKDTFTSGDDFVRYVCYIATGEMLLIKSKEMIESIKEIARHVSEDAIERHTLPLAQVFNRHKRLIIALKTKRNRSVINRISRLSKTQHVPIKEAVNKIFVAKALEGTIGMQMLDQISVRDKFKYLNLLAYKRMQNSVDAFIIRNGKIHIEPDRKVYDAADIDRVERAVLDSLKKDLDKLKGKKILLDPNVRYGLPTSRKQAVGRLPYGTRVTVNGNAISSGIYWENAWGATDLDLSTIDTDGNRTGWGQWSGYDRKNPVTFSGDVTYADRGAMEFMTSSAPSYGLFVNIFSGRSGAEMEVVVGDTNKKQWIENTVIREKTKLNSRGMVVGFVKGKEFVVWQGRIGNSRVSASGANPYVTRGLSEFWTVNDLFEHLGINFEVDRVEDRVYDYDVTYKAFSFDKLEDLLL